MFPFWGRLKQLLELNADLLLISRRGKDYFGYRGPVENLNRNLDLIAYCAPCSTLVPTGLFNVFLLLFVVQSIHQDSFTSQCGLQSVVCPQFTPRWVRLSGIPSSSCGIGPKCVFCEDSEMVEDVECSHPLSSSHLRNCGSGEVF